MSDKFQDILNEIKSNKTVVTVDTLTKSGVKLSPLTLSQQKKIIESAGDETLAVLFFNNVFYSILNENIVEDNISNFNTIDRVQMALALRHYLNNEVEIDDGSKIDLDQILTRNKDITGKVDPEEIIEDNFVFEVACPSLELDDKINKVLLNKYKNATLNQNKLKNLISDLYVYEILKFITNLKINDIEIDLHDNLHKSIQVIEKMDTKVFSKVTEYINKVRDLEAKFAKFLDGEETIEIVPNLFIL